MFTIILVFLIIGFVVTLKVNGESNKDIVNKLEAPSAGLAVFCVLVDLLCFVLYYVLRT